MSQVTDPVMLDTTGQDIVAKLQDVIDAINGGTIDPLTVTQNGTYTPSGTTKGYAPVTVNVSAGGSSVEQKQVNFIDYDGTILHSYTGQEADALTALPANPSHDGLVAQGWNWTLAQIKAQLTAVPDAPVWVGQMYITQSGDTEIDVVMPDGRLSPTLTIAVNGEITVDWGDNTTADTATGSSLTTRQAVPHTYASPGNYTITIHSVSGGFTFYGSSAYTLLRKNTTANENMVYANCVQSVRLGSGITSIGNDAFHYCYSLTSITISSSITSIGTYAFYNCNSLKSITLPSSVTSIANYTFYNCYKLGRISMPSGVTSIMEYAFNNCYSLASITIPNSVTSIGNYAFNNCNSLKSITLPSIGGNTVSGCYCLESIILLDSVTSIGTYAFYSCYGLSTITIPDNVTSIGTYAFYACYGIAEFHLKPTTPPAINANVFSSTSSDSTIYVPAASLETYKTASGWSNYSSRMVGE